MTALVHGVAADAAPAAAAARARLLSVDVLRGVVIALMALDHVRDFVHAGALQFDPLDIERTSPVLFATRWITHYCAPVFVLLAGVSAYLQSAKLLPAALSRRLFTRGLWLILLEVTVIGFAWSFGVDFLFLQVIWAIGWSMIALAFLIRLPPAAVLGVGAAVLLLHNLLDPVQPDGFGFWATLWRAVHESGPLVVGGELRSYFAYPVLPWIGVMALGYGLGPVFRCEAARRRRALFVLGAALTALFVGLRLLDGYGDANGWRAQADGLRTLMDFLSTTKYPPSLQFTAMTLGPALLALAALDGAGRRSAEPWSTFGAVPFFVYVLHVFLAHGAAAALSLLQGYPVWGIADVFRGGGERLQGYGLSLPATYGVWLIVLALLYPAARWFAELKRRRTDWWLSYL